jgi:hypothetical protein
VANPQWSALNTPLGILERYGEYILYFFSPRQDEALLGLFSQTSLELRYSDPV